MDSNIALIVLSAIIVLSYVFDMFARKTQLPSVLLLLALGIILKLVTKWIGIPEYNFNDVLPILGTVGLILIVLEGALELDFDESKKKLIKKTFLMALISLLTMIILVAGMIHYFTTAPLRLCLINAIPYAVISSAIAIPSVANLVKNQKEFIIYESTFSDVVGIVAMNFAIQNSHVHAVSVLHLGVDIVLILALSAIACLLLLYVMGKVNHHIKFFLIISILFLIYGAGKSLHLSSLIIILLFGLFLKNAHFINKPWFQKHFIYKRFQSDLDQFLQITGESAFLIRTYFFTIFGYSMILSELNSGLLWQLGGLMVLFIFISRGVLIKLFAKESLIPLAAIAPRGLVSIMLFYSIPESMKIETFGNALLFVIVIVSSLVMAFGLLRTKPVGKIQT